MTSPDNAIILTLTIGMASDPGDAGGGGFFVKASTDKQPGNVLSDFQKGMLATVLNGLLHGLREDLDAEDYRIAVKSDHVIKLAGAVWRQGGIN